MIELTDEQYKELTGFLGHDPAEDGKWSIANGPTGPCIYAINSKGTIVVRLTCIDSAGRKQKPRKCHIGEFPDHYLFCNLNNKDVRMHRLMAATWLQDWDESLTVNHKDGNKKNNSIDNLEMMTVHDNCIYYHRSDTIKEQREKDYAHHGDTIRGRIHITNGIEARMIHPEDEIPVGWWRGRPQSMKNNESSTKLKNSRPSHNSGKVCITDGVSNRYIDADATVPPGWRTGFTMALSEHQKDHRSEIMAGRIYITKDKINKRIEQHELDKYLSEGWKVGMYSRRWNNA